MSAAWVLYVLGVGTLLAIGAEVSAAASRYFGHSTRFAFAAALTGTLTLAVVAPRPAPARPLVEASVVIATGSVTKVERERTLADRLSAARALFGREAIGLSNAVQRRVSPAAMRVALVGWMGVSATLLLLFLLVNRRLANARRCWPPLSLHGTAVRVSPALGPAVLGFLRPEIVVPRSLFTRSHEEQRLILLHEQEHLCRRDHLLLGGAWLCAIAFPWHPAMWYLTNRVRLAIELDCDARVLRGGASPRSYGALLIDMAARQSAVRIGALALVDGPSHLERRIRAMQWKRGRHAVARGLIVGAMGVLFVLAACEAKVPTAAEVAAMDVSALEKKSAELDRVAAKTTKADYFVNGAPVSADSARSIVAAKIGSVEVVKSQLAGGRDTIFVTTADRMQRARSQDGDDLIPLPAFGRGLSSDAELMIDGVVQQRGVKARLDSKEVASVSVLKPGRDPRYPNGLIAIETKRANRADTKRPPAGKVTMTRTDTFVVRSARGLDAASRSLSKSASSGASRTVLMPGNDSANAYRFGVGDIDRASVTPAAITPTPSVPRMTFDSTKPYAIEIDGVRATRAELDAIRKSGGVQSMTMYVRDARDLSSDPAAENGLMQVRTKRAATQ